MVSWFAHWRPILQMLPDTAPMQFNTAFCFVLCGLGLVLLTTRKAHLAPWLGGTAMLLTSLTLVEYLTGWDLGIDQLFSKPYFEAVTSYPGRMAPLAAVCFIFIGAEIVLANVKKHPARHRAALGLLACVVTAIAIVALAGYAFQMQPAYGWGAYSQMAVNTAAAFLVLSSGLLAWTWQMVRWENSSFLRWLPVTGAATLMVMVAIVSAVNMADLKEATTWRRHTYQVISAAKVFEDSFIEQQRDARGYVTVKTPDLLVAYHGDTNLCAEKFNRLVELTSDNPAQQVRLKAIAAAMQNAVVYDDRIISLYERSGPQAVLQLDATGEGRATVGQVLNGLKIFTDEEQKLLSFREAKEEADYHSVKNLLVFGSVLAVVLLMVANYMASHELKVRRRIESRLSETLNVQNAILGSSSYAIIALDPKGYVRTFNPAAERMLGYSAAEVIGKATPMLWRDPAEVAAQAEKISRELGRPVKPGIEIITGKTVQVTADEYEAVYVRKDGSRFPALISLSTLADASGVITGFLGVVSDITQRKQAEAEREKLIAELQTALAEVKTLSGMIPICGWCKNVRNDNGYWSSVEQYVRAHSEATFSHGMCPDCAKKFEADLFKATDSHGS